MESNESKEVYDKLLSLAQAAPTPNFRQKPYSVVFGIMGSGKSTTVWRAIEKVSKELPDKKYIPCYLRLDNLKGLFPTFKKDVSNVNVLATALLACFTANQVVVHNALNLEQVGERAIKQYGSKYFFLHIDEFQSSPNVTKKLLLACRETIRSSAHGICVVPIVSGIPGLDFPVEASNWPSTHVQLGSLPANELWNAFSKAIGLPASQFGEHKNLSVLFNDCGGYASQVVTLVETIRSYHPLLAGDLNSSEAWAVFRATLNEIKFVYSESRWHAMFSSSYTISDGIPTNRKSWPKTKSIIKQVMLFVLTKKKIPDMKEEFVAGVTWEKCKLTGMVDFVQDGSNLIAKCSLFALFVMNTMANVIPREACLDNAFDDDWQAHERAALVSFMIHLMSHESWDQSFSERLPPQCLFSYHGQEGGNHGSHGNEISN